MQRPTIDNLPVKPLEQGLDLLAIGAHPDDIELSCGGILSKSSSLGYKTGVIDLTRGEKGTRGNREIREKECVKAAEILGLKIRLNMEWPDASIHDNEKNRKELAYVIRLLRPKLVITHHWNCRHPDHIGASKVVERTCMLSGLKKYLEEDRDAPPEWRPDRVLFFGGWHNKNPSAIVDISEHFENKLKAVFAHESQFFSKESKDSETLLSNPDFESWLHQRSRYWGQKIGKEYGESITCKGEIPLQDPIKTFLDAPW